MKDFEDSTDLIAYLEKFDLSEQEKLNLADVKRLLIQERGEEEYYYLYKKKIKGIQDLIEDNFTRQDLVTSLSFFNNEANCSYKKF